jgi:hypothetical protein
MKPLMAEENLFILDLLKLNKSHDVDGNKYYSEDSVIKIIKQTLSFSRLSKEKIVELIEWLNSECPNVTPPLEPYTTADLSHDFAEKLRDKLNDLSPLQCYGETKRENLKENGNNFRDNGQIQ